MYSTKSDLLVVKSAKENCPQVKNKVGEGREDHKNNHNNNNNNRRKNQRKHYSNNNHNNNNNNYNQINLNKIKNLTKTTTVSATTAKSITTAGGGLVVVSQPSAAAVVTSSVAASTKISTVVSTGDSVINKKHIIVSMGMSGIPITSIKTTITPTTVTTSTSTSPQATYSLDFLRHVGLQMTAGRYLVATPSLTNSNNNNVNGNNQQQQINQQEQQQQQQQQLELNNNEKHYQNSTVISNNNNSKESNNGSTIITATTAEVEITAINNNNNNYQNLNRNNFPNNQNQTNQQHYMQQHGHNNINNSNNNYGNYQQHIHTYQQNNNNYHSHNRNHPNMHNGKKYWNYHNNNNNNVKRNSYNNNNNANKYMHITNNNNNNTYNNNNLINRKNNNNNHQARQNITTYTRHIDTNHHVISNSRSPTPSPKSESPPIINKTIIQTGKQQQHQHLGNNNSIQQHQNNIPLSLEPLLSLESLHHHSNNSINGYDSDSSHSSYINNDYIFRSSLITNNNSNNYQMDFLSTTNLLQNTSNDELLLKNLGYYGSHQNLTLYNGNLNHHYSNSVYNNSSESSETGCGVGGINCGGGNGLHITNANQLQTKKKYSGRSSPQNNCNDNGNSINNNNTIGPKMYHRGTKKLQNNNNSINNQSNYRIHGNTGSYHENFLHIHTPPDRFLARAHLVEIKYNHEDLLTGTKWDKLSKSVWDKFVSSQQTEDTYKKKMYLWRYLYIRIKKAFPRFGLYLVGSTISGFGSDTSDVDMCLVTRFVTNVDPRSEAVYTLTDLRNYLISTTGIFEQFHLIQAKVPILRFKDSLHMLEVDLNFNNSVGIRNTHLLHCYSQMDWRLRPLALVVKLWAQNHHINNAKNMTISSYSLVLMVIHFLQYAINPPVLPCLHTMYPDKFQKILEINNIDMNEELEPYYSNNKQTLGELFVLFLEYYSNFDYTQYAISIRTASILPIEDCRQARSIKNDPHQWKQLCIEEPFDLTNTARSVYDGVIFERIKSVFVTSWKTIEETLDLNSVFSQSFLPTGPLHIPMSQQYMPITTTKTILTQTPSTIGTLTTTTTS